MKKAFHGIVAIVRGLVLIVTVAWWVGASLMLSMLGGKALLYVTDMTRQMIIDWQPKHGFLSPVDNWFSWNGIHYIPFLFLLWLLIGIFALFFHGIRIATKEKG